MTYNVETLVVGCGNVLFKDEGFGPAVIEKLEKYFEDKEMPESTMFVDAGDCATHYVFSLPEEEWKKLIVVDTVEFEGEPGEIKFFKASELPEGKYENVHTGYDKEPLLDIAEYCEVIIIGCNPKDISKPYIEMGLSEEIENAVDEAFKLVLDLI